MSLTDQAINVQVSAAHLDTGGLLKQNITTAGANMQIGGNSISVWPTPGYIPNDTPYPLVAPNIWAGTTLGTAWRVSATEEQLSLGIDVPGVKLGDLSVTVDRNVLKVSGKRFDLGTPVSHTYVIPQMFDARSASAVLDSGVLAVQFKKSTEQTLHRVSVKGAK